MGIEIITYRDHWQDESGWTDPEADPKALVCTSIGRVMSENESALCVCSNFDENGRVFGCLIVLKVAIIKRDVVQP